MADWMDKFKDALAKGGEKMDYTHMTPDEIDDLEDELITVEDGDPEDCKGCNFYVWVDEAAEAIIGAHKFVELNNRFAAITGVQKVIHEDREVYFIKAIGHDPSSLEQAMRACWFKLKDE